MLGLDHLTGGTLSSGHRPLVHFQLATGGTFWVATEGLLCLSEAFLIGFLCCGYLSSVLGEMIVQSGNNKKEQ
jgi:hypothetical protein